MARILPLSRIVAWSHQLLTEVLRPGDCAVDLTAGNGYDTLVLAQAVGPGGRVLAFDLQAQALEKTQERLSAARVAIRRSEEEPAALPPGVTLVHGSHAELGHWKDLAPRGIIANLGYLPGGDKALVTRPESTLSALQAGASLLAPGGRMAVVIYTGHAGGQSEAEAVEHFFSALPETDFEVLRLVVANRPQAPYLLIAGKQTG